MSMKLEVQPRVQTTRHGAGRLYLTLVATDLVSAEDIGQFCQPIAVTHGWRPETLTIGAPAIRGRNAIAYTIWFKERLPADALVLH